MATSTLAQPPASSPTQPAVTLPSIANSVAAPAEQTDRDSDVRTATIMGQLLLLLFLWMALVVPLAFVLVGMFGFQ